MPKRLICTVLILGAACVWSAAAAETRIKDVASFSSVRENQLLGYGLVVGLNGTGDRRQTFFSTQTLTNMLERSGITVSPDLIRVKNIAAVMVTTNLPPFARKGSRLDVTVSSIGDAEDIQGGVLIMTPLRGADGEVYVTAQGQLALGGFSASAGANRVQLNHPTVGRIADGGLIEREVPVSLSGRSELSLNLHRNDFTTAIRAVRAINGAVGNEVASAVDARTIRIRVPEGYGERIVEFISVVENARMEVDFRAKVVLNERTGTIVMGKDVQISAVSIIHGSLSLQVGTTFAVSQPAPFGQGQTKVVPETTLKVDEEKGRTVSLVDGASVEDVVRALNSIGAGPRDVIAILQAIKAAGALQAELEII
ncbi:MAG: flagellar basal body P-ring protein FlgI [Acidobacteria bacterium]|nr:flagellar basal body P-ring protein FlgI [Acidobacteriota bacterium]